MLANQARQIAAQNEKITEQDRLIANQQSQLNAMRAERAAPIEVAATQSALTPPPPTALPRAAAAPERPLSSAESGETEEVIRPSLLASIPQGMGVLTPRKGFLFEPSVEYDRAGANTEVFAGVNIISPLPTGPTAAAAAAHDVVVTTGTFRYGLSDRVEVEARAPFLYRNDRLSPLAPQGMAGQSTDLSGSDIGDLQFAARYQINASREGEPTLVANLQARAPTGRGPYDTGFQADGTTTNLATGSGFWGIEPSVTFLLPIDPIIMFGNVGYLKNFSRDINKTVGQTRVGNVDPGDSIDTAFGFGAALNPKFSFSLGYSNNYIFGANRELNGIVQSSRDLEVGSLIFGWAYRLRSNLLISTNFQFGVTPDAPDVRVAIRLPISF